MFIFSFLRLFTLEQRNSFRNPRNTFLLVSIFNYDFISKSTLSHLTRKKKKVKFLQHFFSVFFFKFSKRREMCNRVVKAKFSIFFQAKLLRINYPGPYQLPKCICEKSAQINLKLKFIITIKNLFFFMRINIQCSSNSKQIL